LDSSFFLLGELQLPALKSWPGAFDIHQVGIVPMNPTVHALIQEGEKAIGAVFPEHFHPRRILIVVKKGHPLAQKRKGRFIEAAG
jgi:hypothetical protein